jgi:hypothetical protein
MEKEKKEKNREKTNSTVEDEDRRAIHTQHLARLALRV